MNLEELHDWITVINVALARAQRPDATYLACPVIWGCFERVVDFDAKPIVLLEVLGRANDRSDIIIRSRTVYDVRDTMGGDFPDRDAVMEIAQANACYLDYESETLVIFESD